MKYCSILIFLIAIGESASGYAARIHKCVNQDRSYTLTEHSSGDMNMSYQYTDNDGSKKESSISKRDMITFVQPVTPHERVIAAFYDGANYIGTSLPSREKLDQLETNGVSEFEYNITFYLIDADHAIAPLTTEMKCSCRFAAEI